MSKSPILDDPREDEQLDERAATLEDIIPETPLVCRSTDKAPLRSDAIYVVVCRVVGIAATMAGHMLASRWLGPTEYGQFVLLTTLIALGSIFAMKGLNEAGLRFLAESLARGGPQLAQSFLLRIGWTLLVNSMVATIVFAAAMLLFHTYIRSFNDPFWLIALTSGGMMLLAWQQVTAESLRGYGELGRASLYSGGQTGGPVSNLLFLALFGLSAWYFLSDWSDLGSLDCRRINFADPSLRFGRALESQPQISWPADGPSRFLTILPIRKSAKSRTN